MTTALSLSPVALTISEYAALPDGGRLTELVRGVILEIPWPTPRHGQICATTGFALSRLLERDCGHVVNGAGIITERDPGTLRTADVAFYSYDRVPRGELPNEFIAVSPEMVFEVRSPNDRWPDLLKRVTEYLKAGVIAVVVLDSVGSVAHVFTAEALREFDKDEILELPEPLADFRLEVARFFE